MKKINSIDYGAKVIGIGLIFLAVIPIVFYIVNCFLSLSAIRIVIFISMGIGAVIEIGFGCHLAIELRQDKLIDRYYSEHPSSTKTPQEILNERNRG